MRALRLVAAATFVALAACSPRFDWREIRQPQAGYLVALPDRPQTAAREIAFEHPGGAVRAEMTMLSSGVGASLFAVGSVRLPRFALEPHEALEATLDWFGDGLLRNLQATAPTPADAGPPAGLGTRKLLATRAFTAAGSAGSGRPARLAVRLYVVDDRLFQLVALVAEGEVPPQALETFFDSFRLTP
ncbi:MAG: hypothetical protein KBE19_13860 [Rhodocyclaceae bacterium]|nr:hypothetical protein [Rhodocyclaceae bacterium]